MLTTKDYEAHEHEIGKIVYVLTAHSWDNDKGESTSTTVSQFPTIKAAKLHAAESHWQLEAWQIEPATWVEDAYEDDQYGFIQDAELQFDTDGSVYGDVNGETIDWDDA